MHGIHYQPSEKTKSELFLELLPGINSRRVELLDSPRLVSQLTRLERRTARSGKDSIDHQPGGHDDLANAVAGAIYMTRPVLVQTGPPQLFAEHEFNLFSTTEQEGEDDE